MPAAKPVATVAVSEARAQSRGLVLKVAQTLPDHSPAIIQFVACNRLELAKLAADEFCFAAADCLGLIISVETGASDQSTTSHIVDNTHPLVLPRRSFWTQVIPDAEIRNLLHLDARRLSASTFSHELRQLPLTSTFANKPLRAVVLSSGDPGVDNHTLDIASACTGTVLVVEAGRSNLQHMARTIQSLRDAGASLLGAVMLHDRARG